MVLDELYVTYSVPAALSARLGRGLRRAPIFGTDFVYEDAQEGAPRMGNLFNNVYVGDKKVLTLMHGSRNSSNSCGTPTSGHLLHDVGPQGVVPFPNLGSGQWEVRDVYLMEMTRLPSQARGYCYGKRRLYLDKENYFPVHTEVWDWWSRESL